ncbi:hypothetical protein D3C78_1633690 [compost metagenome]
MFIHCLNHFNQCSYTGFIIRAENGSSIASNPSILTNDWLNSVARSNCIHMTCEQKWLNDLTVDTARFPGRNQIPCAMPCS